MSRGARVRGRLGALACWTAAAVVLGALTWIVGDVVVRGVSGLSLDFLTHEPTDAGKGGGIGPVVVATLLVLVVCIGVAAPIGIGAAVLLAEASAGRRAFGRLVRGSLETLAAVPSIVFGLFGYAFFVQALGLGYSILAGGLTLACMVLPILIRTTEEALRAVPAELRLGAAALGVGRLTALRALLLPAAAPGLGAGLVLGLGRASAETAALLFTAGYVSRMPRGLSDPGRVLSVHVYDMAMNVPGGDAAAYRTALVLVALVLVLNAAARLFTRGARERSL